MKKPIEYFYSAYSAYAYIGHSDFLKLASDAEREVIHRPFDLMKCLNAIGYHPLEERTDLTFFPKKVFIFFGHSLCLINYSP